MPLRDHFHPPLEILRDWHGFHHGWATAMANALNEWLPADFVALPNVQFRVEIDVSTWESPNPEGAQPLGPIWTPPAPTATLPLPVLTDLVEVRVVRHQGGPQLVGAVEVVSPANKDRPASRDAFASKCAAYLQQGIGLVVIDTVTSLKANLHDALLARLLNGEAPVAGSDLYAASYHPVERDDATQFDLWVHDLKLGDALPKLPLWLRGGLCAPLDLEASYERTCRDQRFPPP